VAIKSAKDIQSEFFSSGSEIDADFLRYVYENFQIIKDILYNGITAQFVTVNDKLLTVVGGILVGIEPSFDGVADAMLLETGDYLLLETGDNLLFEETVIS
jgi:hypothetical protein